MKLARIDDFYLNLDNVTHVEFVPSGQGQQCTVYFNCEVGNGGNAAGGQVRKTLGEAASRQLRAILDLSLKSPAGDQY